MGRKLMCDTKQPRKGEGGRRNFYTLTKYRKKSSLKLARFSVPFRCFVVQCEEECTEAQLLQKFSFLNFRVRDRYRYRDANNLKQKFRVRFRYRDRNANWSGLGMGLSGMARGIPIPEIHL